MQLPLHFSLSPSLTLCFWRTNDCQLFASQYVSHSLRQEMCLSKFMFPAWNTIRQTDAGNMSRTVLAAKWSWRIKPSADKSFEWIDVYLSLAAVLNGDRCRWFVETYCLLFQGLSPTLKMKICFSETPVSTDQSTWHDDTEGQQHHPHSRENFISQLELTV
jgi:hypothetical protein